MKTICYKFPKACHMTVKGISIIDPSWNRFVKISRAPKSEIVIKNWFKRKRSK